MLISLETIVNEWVELGSLASSSRNDAVNDYQAYYQGNYPGFAE